MKSIILTVGSLLPLTQALVGVSWNMPNVPSTGLKTITFPISMPDVAHKSGFYFAQQYGFANIKDIGYTGLQPREDSNGQSIVHAVFSSFQAGSTSNDTKCHSGADGGAGVSCSVDVPSDYSHPYELLIKNTRGTTWTGTLVDTVTKKTTHVGSYTLPSGAGGILGSELGFVEYYPWNAGTHTCPELPFTNVTFGVPRTGNGGTARKAVQGSLDKPYEYGDCVGKAGFKTTQVQGGGFEVQVGF